MTSKRKNVSDLDRELDLIMARMVRLANRAAKLRKLKSRIIRGHAKPGPLKLSGTKHKFTAPDFNDPVDIGGSDDEGYGV